MAVGTGAAAAQILSRRPQSVRRRVFGPNHARGRPHDPVANVLVLAKIDFQTPTVWLPAVPASARSAARRAAGSDWHTARGRRPARGRRSIRRAAHRPRIPSVPETVRSGRRADRSAHSANGRPVPCDRSCRAAAAARRPAPDRGDRAAGDRNTTLRRPRPARGRRDRSPVRSRQVIERTSPRGNCTSVPHSVCTSSTSGFDPINWPEILSPLASSNI